MKLLSLAALSVVLLVPFTAYAASPNVPCPKGGFLSPNVPCPKGGFLSPNVPCPKGGF